MKTRHLYVLLYALPALLAAAVVAFGLVGAAAGFLWLFVLGDSPWPPWADHLLVAVGGVAWVSSWLGFLAVAYGAGRRRQGRSPALGRHALASVGATVLVVLLVLGHQFAIGNLGRKSDAVACGEFCLEKGYAASSRPPKGSGPATCSCLDGLGQTAFTVPLQALRAGAAQ